MKSFVNTFLIILFVSILNVPASAQDDYEPCYWGLIFNWGPDFTLGKYNVGSYFDDDDDENQAVGIGVEKYLTPRWSVTGGLSIGIDNISEERTQGEDEFSSSELALKLGANYYFHGRNNVINPFASGWLSYTSFSQTQTFKPTEGNETENEYSSSTIGIGASFGVYVKPWRNEGFNIGACYNLAYFTSPASTISTTANGQTTERDGPSHSRLTDCGAQLMVKYDF